MTMSTMFMNTMSDIVIKRFNVHKQPQDQIKTRIVYAPKQRVLLDLLDKDQNIQLPVVSVNIGGIARDESRVFNKILGTFHVPAKSTTVINEKGPLPLDVTYNVSIMTRYQQDMDQILSHLLPYINPYFVVSWRTPNRPDFEIRSSVFWSGQANIQYPTDVSSTQVARVVCDLSFTFKGWLFQNPELFEQIFTFDTSYINVNGIPPEYLLDSNEPRTSNENADFLFYYGAPPKPKVIEPSFATVGVPKHFNVWGTGMEVITNVYLSGNPVAYISSIQNPFSQFKRLSADYPSFFATKLLSTQWSYDGDGYMTFLMPSANMPGTVDLIVENPGGYGKLIGNVRLNTFNPFDPTSPDYITYEPPQVAFLSGINIDYFN